MADLGRFFETLAFTGGGMATGNIPGALAQMGQLRQNRQSQAFDQQMQQQKMDTLRAEQERKARQAAVMQAVAPGVAAQLYPNSPQIQMMLAQNPALLGDMLKQRAAAAAPTNPERIYNAMGGQAGTGKTLQDWYTTDYKGGGTNITVGGETKFGAVPGAMARVPDPTSPTGTTLVEEPGSPAAARREEAEKAKIAPLDSLQDSLARYRATLKRYGPTIMTGTGKAELDADYTDLLLKQKEAAKLGALTGPDLELMQRMMIDPTSLTGQWYEKTGNVGALDAQLNSVQRTLADARARAAGEEPPERRTLATQENPAQVANDTDYDALKTGDYYVGPDGVLRVK